MANRKKTAWEKMTPSSVTLPNWMWAELNELVERGKAKSVSALLRECAERVIDENKDVDGS